MSQSDGEGSANIASVTGLKSALFCALAVRLNNSMEDTAAEP
jgi:hypothetical protein